jgi:MFS family permease
VRVNLAILSLLTPLVGFSPLAFGAISDAHGRLASFQVAAGILVLALALIGLLPADPAPRENSNLQSA